MSPSVEPFNEVKYRALIDGLECSEINLCYVRRKFLRIDAEYYQKNNLILESIIEAEQGKTISSHNGKTDCSAFYPSITGYYSDDKNDIPFLRVNEIVNGLVVVSDKTVFLPEEVLKVNSKTIALAYPGDIIIAKGGNTLAKVGLVTNEYSVYATCRDVIILRTDKITDLNKFYLWAYLHSSFGQKMMWRSASQTGQPHLTLKSIDMIHVPEYCAVLQNAVERLYNQSVSLKQRSQKEYSSATELLEEVLNIPLISGGGVSVKNISESFRTTGRLDAEYYQEKYQIYESAVRSSTQGYTYIKDAFFSVKEKCLRDRSFYDYVEIGDIDIETGRATFNTINAEKLPENAKIMTKKGDVLVSTVRPNRGAVSVLEEDGLLVSGAFAVLRESGKYPKEVLQVVLRTTMYKDWLLRFNVGTSYPVIKNEDVLNIPIPLLEESAKQNIVSRVKEAVVLRRQSQQLLKYAKITVETAIEQGEEAALAWLNQRMGE